MAIDTGDAAALPRDRRLIDPASLPQVTGGGTSFVSRVPGTQIVESIGLLVVGAAIDSLVATHARPVIVDFGHIGQIVTQLRLGTNSLREEDHLNRRTTGRLHMLALIEDGQSRVTDRHISS